MDIVKLAIECKECSNFLVKPVMLPCGSSVCYQHLINLQQGTFYCKSCDHDHLIDKNNLVVNKSLEILINANLDKINFGSQYNTAFKRLNELDQAIGSLETILNNPTLFIKQVIDRMKNTTEIIREELKLKIDDKANQMIDQLDQYEKECIDNLDSIDLKQKLAKIDEQIVKVKEDLELRKATLNDFSSCENEWDKVKRRCNENNIQYRKEMWNLKKELLLNKINHNLNSVLAFQDVKITSDTKFYDEMDEYVDLLKQPHISTSKILDDDKYEWMLDLCEIPIDSKLKLIYRASEHGFTANDFHSKCDNVSNTLTVIKTRDEWIFGGYTSQAWDKSGMYKNDPEAYLFSLVNPQEQPDKLFIKNSSKAICCHDESGPTFGSGPDLYISFSENYSCLGNSYSRRYYWDDEEGEDFFVENLADDDSFSIFDIEIYKIH